MISYIKHKIFLIIEWKVRNGLNILRVSLAVIFFWFGFLKFFPGLSTAEQIAAKTILWITRGNLQANWSMPILATWECMIALGLLFRKWLTATLFLLYCQMMGTLLPLIVFRADTWTDHWFVPTLLGQYIIKNAVLVAAGLVIGATINGGGMTAHPVIKKWFVHKKKFHQERGVM